MAVIGTDWVNGIFEDYFYITVRYIAVQCICLLAMFVFVRQPEDIIPYCIISVLATNGGNLINVFYIRKYAKIRFTFDMDLKRHLVPLLILFVNSIAITIYVNSDITMLGFFESDAQVCDDFDCYEKSIRRCCRGCYKEENEEEQWIRECQSL